MAKKGLRLVRSDFDIVQEMIETGELFEGFTYAEAINRLFKWYMGEENLSFDEAVSATEDWLDENGVYYSHEAVVDKAKWCLNKKGELKDKLIKLDVVEIYENEIQMIKQLPNTHIKRAYFTMMVSCKLRKQREQEPWNKLYNPFEEFVAYCGGKFSAKTEKIEGLNWLQQNGYIDVPLDDLDGYYYTGVEGSGKVVYEIDGTKLDRDNFGKIYADLFFEKTYKIMVIDLDQERGYVLKDSITDVIEYLKEQGVKTSNGNINKILNHDKYAIQQRYTLVRVLYENEDWLRGAEILQRSLEPCAKVALKQVSPYVIHAMFQQAQFIQDDYENIRWFVYKKDDKQSLVSKLRQ